MNHSNRARRGIAPLPFAAWLASLALLIVSSFAVPGVARAQTINDCPTVASPNEGVCNLNQDIDADSSIAVAPDAFHANAFTVGEAALGYNVTAVRLRVADADDAVPSSNPGALTVAIYDNTGGGPGTSLGTLTNPDAFAKGVVYAFDAPAAGITLAKGGTYWLVLSKSAGDDISFDVTQSEDDDVSPRTSAGWSIEARATGTTFANLATVAANSGIVQFAVLASPITPPACPTTSGTQETVCNLDEAAAGVINSSGTTIGQAFTVGGTTGAAYSLNSVRLRIENVGRGVSMTLAIHPHDSSTTVGELPIDGTLICPALAAGVVDCFASGMTVRGGSTYYVVPTVTASVTFASTSSEDEDGDTGWMIGARQFMSSTGWRAPGGTPTKLRMAIVATPGSAGPALPVLTIAKVADATEGEDDSIDFAVTPSIAFTAAQTVTVTLASNPATDLDPYIPASARSGMVTFAMGDDMDDAKTVTFAITDDEIDNGGVEVTATIAPNNAVYHTGAGAMATAQIDDDDGSLLPRVELGSGSDVNEGAESGVIFTVQPSRAFAARQVITVTVSGNIDFLADSSPMTVTYEAGETQEKSVNFPLRANDCVQTGGGTITAGITPDAAFTVSGTGNVQIIDAGDAPGCIPALNPALRLKLRVFLESALP